MAVKPETVRSALELAGLHGGYFEEFAEARNCRSTPGLHDGCPCLRQRRRGDQLFGGGLVSGDHDMNNTRRGNDDGGGDGHNDKHGGIGGVGAFAALRRRNSFKLDQPQMAQRRCRFKVGKDAQHVRVVDRAFMTVARAFLADVDVIVLNRTEMVFSDDQRARLYGSLRKWVDEGLEGAEALCAGVPRLRTVFVTQHEKQRPPQVNAELVLGVGELGTGMRVDML